MEYLYQGKDHHRYNQNNKITQLHEEDKSILELALQNGSDYILITAVVLKNQTDSMLFVSQKTNEFVFIMCHVFVNSREKYHRLVL